ncbi:hypothetical protein VIGAN_07128200, partial [Vigna angularis var. angularis]
CIYILKGLPSKGEKRKQVGVHVSARPCIFLSLKHILHMNQRETQANRVASSVSARFQLVAHGTHGLEAFPALVQ